MHKKDFTLQINLKLWEKALKKIETDFGRKYCQTDCALIILLLALYSKKNKLRSEDNRFLVCETPDELDNGNYITKTIYLYRELLEELKNLHPNRTNSQVFEFALADFLYLPTEFFTDCITPLYSIVGSKNNIMQSATADAVSKMNLNTKDLMLVDACCATGSLFFGLKTAVWKQVILNDMNPLRTNFLNVLKSEPLKLIKKLLDTDLNFIKQRDPKNENLRIFKNATDVYQEKRCHYTKVDCDIEIAYNMFLQQCIDKAMIEDSSKIFKRILRFLPAHLKLMNATITQTDCLTYLTNNHPKLVLLDVPYIGSEKECAIKGYHYIPFHEKVSRLLLKAEYPSYNVKPIFIDFSGFSLNSYLIKQS